MMRTFLVVIATTLAAVSSAPVQYYASKYDHIDVDTILNTRRLVNYYAACLTNKGPCPPQGIEFKRILPEALRTTCARCTEKQKVVALRTIKRIRKEYPKIWSQLSEIWDPTGEYIKRFEESFTDSNEIIPQATTFKTAPKPNTFKPPNQFSQTTSTTTTTQKSVTFESRFGESSNVDSVITSTNAPQIANRPENPITTPSKPTITSTINIVTPTTPPATKKTTTPVLSLKADGVFFFPSPVSLNPPQISVNGLVSRLGSLGTKVIKAGTRIAGMLLSTVQTVVGQ